jgi:hypothetical protein
MKNHKRVLTINTMGETPRVASAVQLMHDNATESANYIGADQATSEFPISLYKGKSANT